MNSVKVAILGRPYTISSDDDPEHIKRCVEILNKRIAKISETAKIASTLDAAIFSALSFVDDILKMDEGTSLKDESDIIENKISSIIKMIDSKI